MKNEHYVLNNFEKVWYPDFDNNYMHTGLDLLLVLHVHTCIKYTHDNLIFVLIHLIYRVTKYIHVHAKIHLAVHVIHSCTCCCLCWPQDTWFPTMPVPKGTWICTQLAHATISWQWLQDFQDKEKDPFHPVAKENYIPRPNDYSVIPAPDFMLSSTQIEEASQMTLDSTDPAKSIQVMTHFS